MIHKSHARGRSLACLITIGTCFAATPLLGQRSVVAATSAASAVTDSTATGGDDALAGRSGKLRLRTLGEKPRLAVGVLERLFGDRAVTTPGLHAAQDSTDERARGMTLATLVPFSAKNGGRVGTYRVGFWPAERRAPRSEMYVNPEGFIEVTRETQDLQVSEHFRLRDFLTHDQGAVWPKYVVLRDELVDKLELVIDELQRSGVSVSRVTVLSGFRTPQYNDRGVGRKGGRARDSRHQFGDAADVFVDDDGDGRMDDLNRDGRVNAKDAAVIEAAVSRVESRYPELVGGVGLYRATRSHGPFVHIDVRGARARWGRA